MLCGLIVALCAGIGPAWAAAPAGMQLAVGGEPMAVDAQSMELRGKEGRVIFQGDVVAHRVDLTLEADRVEVRLDAEKKNVESMVATGHVRVRKADILASGDRGEYQVAQGLVTLTGSPKIWRDRDAVEGEVVRLFLEDERVVIEKAKAVLYPKAGTTLPGLGKGGAKP